MGSCDPSETENLTRELPDNPSPCVSSVTTDRSNYCLEDREKTIMFLTTANLNTRIAARLLVISSAILTDVT